MGDAAGEMLTAAEPHLESKVHPTVICRAYMKALDDAVSSIDKLAFQIDFDNTAELLKVVESCIATKLTKRFGSLIPVRINIPWHVL
jgi:T-complex protein 1 subunit gamma